MKNKRIWHVICVKWIGQERNGAKVIKARPEGGKYINGKCLPEHVKLAFDLSDDGEYVRSFTSENAIKTFIENGAVIKKYNLIFYRITFEVTDYRKKTNIKNRERVKHAKRDILGRFKKE